jgi:2-keto-4-pentenoate hydratase/2-oxohepta-3-ene-1,7-dioic acid hydratase in catechol pathway
MAARSVEMVSWPRSQSDRQSTIDNLVGLGQPKSAAGMRLVTFTADGRDHLGVLIGNEVADLSVLADTVPASVAACCALDGGSLAALAKAAQTVPRRPLADVQLKAPIPRPGRNIFCVGKNYHEHAKEFATSGFDASAKEVVPEAPVVFTKPPSAVIGPGAPIPAHYDKTNSVDYEGEFTVVIGTGGRDIRRRGPTSTSSATPSSTT